MRRVTSSAGAAVSYETTGDGPPLVLVHAGFSDHRTNWEFVRPLFDRRFTVHAVARRGRGATTATTGHRMEDEAGDVAAVLQAIGQPVFLLGHSYGAHVALAAAAEVPALVRKLVLYEPPRPDAISAAVLSRLKVLAAEHDWDEFAVTFFRDGLLVPAAEVDHLRATELWPPILADAPATVGDIQALTRYEFDAEWFGGLRVPVLLQTGTESPRHLYATDALAAALPDATVAELAGQAHEGMTTAPEMYAEAVTGFLLG
jgi:pimeloyl-ACP methyl ester carboxylesterase